MSKQTSKLQKYEYIYEIVNSKAETIANIYWIKVYINNIMFDAREFTR